MLIRLPDISMNWNHLLCIQVGDYARTTTTAKDSGAFLQFFAPSHNGRRMVYELGFPSMEAACKLKERIDVAYATGAKMCDLTDHLDK